MGVGAWARPLLVPGHQDVISRPPVKFLTRNTAGLQAVRSGRGLFGTRKRAQGTIIHSRPSKGERHRRWSLEEFRHELPKFSLWA